MANKPGYSDISVTAVQPQYTDNPTDTQLLDEEIPKFDSVTNLWLIPNKGISYSCLTMQQIQYAENARD